MADIIRFPQARIAVQETDETDSYAISIQSQYEDYLDATSDDDALMAAAIECVRAEYPGLSNDLVILIAQNVFNLYQPIAA